MDLVQSCMEYVLTLDCAARDEGGCSGKKQQGTGDS